MFTTTPDGLPVGECVLHEGYITPRGYGMRGRVLVHREALAVKLGRPVAPHMDACHSCDNRACVNPDHLYEGTRKQNMADCSARDRHNKPRGETHWRAKLSAEQVREMRALSEAGATRKELGEKYRVNAATVSRIVRHQWRTEERPSHAPDYLEGVVR